MKQPGLTKAYCLFTFFITFLVYLATLCPTLYGGDSGELITVAHTLGIAHPPGHPTYVILGKIFSLLPLGSIAFRLNLMSALFGALTCVLLFLIIIKILPESWHRKPIAFFSSLIFGFSLSFWNFSLFAETYTLHIFFVSLFLLLLFHIKDDEKNFYRLSYLFSSLLGISLGNHPLMAAWIPVFALFFLVYKGKEALSFSYISKVLLCFLLGFSVYLYLPIRGHFNPQFNLSRVTNLSSFLSTLLFVQYRQIQVASQPISLSLIYGKVKILAGWIMGEFPLPVLAVMAASFYYLYRRYLKLFLIFLAIFVMALIIYINDQKLFFSVDRASYFIPVYLILSICMAIGIDGIAAGLVKIRRQKLRNALIMVFFAALLFSLAIQFNTNYKLNDKSANYLVYDIASAMLDTLEPNSVLIVHEDWPTFSLAYMQAVEHRRPDVTIYSRNGSTFPGIAGYYPKELKNIYDVIGRSRFLENEFIRKTDRPVYFNVRKLMYALKDAYRLSSRGLLYKVVPIAASGQKPRDLFLLYNIRGLDRPIHKQDLVEAKILLDYYVHLGEYYFEMNLKDKGLDAFEKAKYFAEDTFSERQTIATAYIENGYYGKALEIFEEQLKILPIYPPTYKNIGYVYGQYLHDYKKSINYLTKYLEMNPRAYDKEAISSIIEDLKRSSATPAETQLNP